ncbi:MAG TPA: hypothetical protein PKU94_01815 [Candidatus Hydrothermia bacterium]|nr:hypothetical protein [Candidatus Hydrothermia bacterium]
MIVKEKMHKKVEKCFRSYNVASKLGKGYFDPSGILNDRHCETAARTVVDVDMRFQIQSNPGFTIGRVNPWDLVVDNIKQSYRKRREVWAFS